MASLFSKIIAGEIPGTFIFDETHWVGLLDLFPVSPGHLLLIPKQEAPLVGELDSATAAAMGNTISRASTCLYQALNCDAISVLIRDGAAAGQEIPHVHIHLIPRFEGDAAHQFKGGRYGDSDDAVKAAMAKMAATLQAAWPAS